MNILSWKSNLAILEDKTSLVRTGYGDAYLHISKLDTRKILLYAFIKITYFHTKNGRLFLILCKAKSQRVLIPVEKVHFKSMGAISEMISHHVYIVK